MDYQELSFTVFSEEDYRRDLLISQLADIGFDTFEETDEGFKAYIPAVAFNELELQAALKSFEGDFDFCYGITFIPQKNWNEVWESNFEPLIIGNSCYVRANFHAPNPEYPYEIIINPKMAFGTGHHQTTAMMMELMLKEDFKQKTVLDMGCGTGILSILASKLGAEKIIAIDNDVICYDSTIENTRYNDIINVEALHGSAEVIPDQQYDIIMANINRNILLEQLDHYASVLKSGGVLLLSGFYETPDLTIIKEKAQTLHLVYSTYKKCQDWVAVRFVK